MRDNTAGAIAVRDLSDQPSCEQRDRRGVGSEALRSTVIASSWPSFATRALRDMPYGCPPPQA